ncbi:MAG: hypothetical protein WCT37_05350 [Patescibacteria group bacterium]|jgi:hypothetical protein
MRLLREYTYKARISHFCICCCEAIEPKQFYTASVWADDRHGIVVFKQHSNPCCDPVPDPDEDERLRNSEMDSESDDQAA